MSPILASAPVPAANRLDDADTVNLAAFRPAVPAQRTASPFAGETPAQIGRRIWELQSTYVTPLSDREVARRLGISERDVNEAATAYLLATRPAEQDDDLISQAFRANPEAVRRMADIFRAGEAGNLTGEQVKDALVAFARELGVFPDGDDRYADGYVDGMQRTLAARPAACPAWCSHDHRGDIDTDEATGWTLGLVHEQVLVELVGVDAATVEAPATVTVLIESTTEAGTVVTPARVMLTIAEGGQGGYPGSEGVQGWTGTPDQARALAAALVSAANLLDDATR